MEVVAALRLLRRHRLLVALGAVVALLVGIAILAQAVTLPAKLQARDTAIGVASARVVLASAPQQSRRIQAQFTDSLGVRAQLVANLMATDDVRADIARGAGLKPDQVVVRGPSNSQPTIEIPLAVKAAEAAALATEPYGLTVSVNAEVPIISFKATGPDARGAARVVDSASRGVDKLLASLSVGEPAIRVEGLGPALRRTVVTHAQPIVGVAVAIVVFLGWCAAMVLLAGLDRRWRRRSAAPEFSPAG